MLDFRIKSEDEILYWCTMQFQISEQTKHLIELALREDLGQGGDVTSNSVIPSDVVGSYVFTAREDIVLCGLPIVEHIIASAGEAIQFEAFQKDGDKLQAGTQIAKLSGNIREILRIERVALNFMQHLSGIATLTNAYVQEIAHTNAKIYDTRKTTPAFRELEKYAVRCGGGQNHRMRLDDMVLIKDNHITAAGGIAITVKKAREYLSSQPVFIMGFNHEMPHQVREVMLEVDTLDQLQQAIMAQPDIILLDNFSLENLKKAVALVGGKIPLEASGGVNLQTVKAIAESGVDRISTSKITQSAPAVDIGLDEYF